MQGDSGLKRKWTPVVRTSAKYERQIHARVASETTKLFFIPSSSSATKTARRPSSTDNLSHVLISCRNKGREAKQAKQQNDISSASGCLYLSLSQSGDGSR